MTAFQSDSERIIGIIARENAKLRESEKEVAMIVHLGTRRRPTKQDIRNACR